MLIHHCQICRVVGNIVNQAWERISSPRRHWRRRGPQIIPSDLKLRILEPRRVGNLHIHRHVNNAGLSGRLSAARSSRRSRSLGARESGVHRADKFRVTSELCS